MKEQNYQNQFERMTQAPVERLVLKLAVPTIITMLITMIYNMADTFFVGQLSTEATAGVGVVFALMALIQTVGFFFGQGSGIMVSRLLGMKKNENAAETIATGFVFSLIGGGVITLFGFCFMYPFARLLGATDEIIAEATSYMTYILAASPIMVAAFTMNNVLRYQGYATFAMIGMITGGILNMALDPVFIFVLGMGTGGAALATAISQCVSFVILFVMTEKKGIKIRLKNARLSFRVLGGISSCGFPSLARQGSASIGTMIFNNLAGGYGAAAIAAMSIVTRVMMLAGAAQIGYGQGFQPVCGFNYGANLYTRVKRAYVFCAKTSVFVLIAISVVLAIWAPQILATFRNDPKVIEIGSTALRFQCIGLPLFGFITLTNMIAQSIGRVWRATVLAIGRQFMFFVPSALILNYSIGLTGLEMSQMIADVLTCILAIPVARSIFREFSKAIEAGTAQ